MKTNAKNASTDHSQSSESKKKKIENAQDLAYTSGGIGVAVFYTLQMRNLLSIIILCRIIQYYGFVHVFFAIRIQIHVKSIVSKAITNIFGTFLFSTKKVGILINREFVFGTYKLFNKVKNHEFLKLYFTFCLRIRISVPDPDGDLNTDTPGSTTLEVFHFNIKIKS